jgi:hypothetical protein
MKAARVDRRWNSSSACTDATATPSRTFCAEYARLQGELAAAEAAAKMDEDTWDAIIKSGTAKVRSHPATLDGEERFEADNCPFMVPEELIKRRREQGPWVFSCQMLLKPQGDTSQGFKREWIRYAEGEPHAAGLNVYITVDPAHSKKRSSDYTVMACIGVGGEAFALEASAVAWCVH